MDKFKDKNILITGSCGTVGSELLRLLSASGAGQIICVDNNETELFFQEEAYRKNGNIFSYLLDITDKSELQRLMNGVDIVLHAAACKHVGLCEQSPMQAVKINILGTQNVIECARESGVERVIFTSSDKAVNPTNVMGTTKLMGERLMTAAAQNNAVQPRDKRKRNTIFASTRFGNVLGSRGSVVPLFQKQIMNGGPVTLTDRHMTRFVMTLAEAANLVLSSVWKAVGGEVMVTKMPVARIEDIANVMIEVLSPSTKISIVEIGAKAGEKMYEELMNDEEIRRTKDLGDFFVISSPFINVNDEKYSHLLNLDTPDRPYNSASENTMNHNELKKYFTEKGVIP